MVSFYNLASHLISLLGLIIFLYLILVLGWKVFKLFNFRIEFWLAMIFSIALGLVILGNLIYFLGLLKLLYPVVIYLLFILIILICRQEIISLIKIFKKEIEKIDFSFLKDRLNLIIFLIILGYLILNLAAALSPETEFDALWYHLTLPKLYLKDHRVGQYFGWLELVSASPRFLEMIYVPILAIFKIETVAKLLHFSLGILAGVAIYFMAKKFYPQKIGLIFLSFFFSLPLFSWLSHTAYVDFGVLFFGILAIIGLLFWSEDKNQIWLILAGIFGGITMAIKIINIYFLPVLIGGITFICLIKRKKFKLFSSLGLYVAGFGLAFLPWAIEAAIRTGNPFYPTLSAVPSPDWQMAAGLTGLKEWLLYHYPKALVVDFKKIFFEEISPFLLLILILPFFWRKLSFQIKLVLFLTIFGFLLWSYIPVYVSRYLIVFIVLMILLASLSFELLRQSQFLSPQILTFLLILGLFSLFLVNFKQNKHYLRYALGIENRQQYLSREIPKDIWDFYDIDKEINQNLKETDKVLVYGIHNFYYLDFNYIDATAVINDFKKIDNLDDFVNQLAKLHLTHTLIKVSNLQGEVKYLVGEKNGLNIISDPHFDEHFIRIYQKPQGTAFVDLFQIVY